MSRFFQEKIIEPRPSKISLFALFARLFLEVLSVKNIPFATPRRDVTG
jgi:hypothetical protein